MDSKQCYLVRGRPASLSSCRPYAPLGYEIYRGHRHRKLESNPDSDLPANYEIDYIRAYKSQANEFMWQWGNGGTKQIHWWDMNPTDRYFSGRFEGNGKAQLLAIATNQWGWAQMRNS